MNTVTASHVLSRPAILGCAIVLFLVFQSPLPAQTGSWNGNSTPRPLERLHEQIKTTFSGFGLNRDREDSNPTEQRQNFEQRQPVEYLVPDDGYRNGSAQQRPPQARQQHFQTGAETTGYRTAPPGSSTLEGGRQQHFYQQGSQRAPSAQHGGQGHLPNHHGGNRNAVPPQHYHPATQHYHPPTHDDHPSVAQRGIVQAQYQAPAGNAVDSSGFVQQPVPPQQSQFLQQPQFQQQPQSGMAQQPYAYEPAQFSGTGDPYRVADSAQLPVPQARLDSGWPEFRFNGVPTPTATERALEYASQNEQLRIERQALVDQISQLQFMLQQHQTALQRIRVEVDEARQALELANETNDELHNTIANLREEMRLRDMETTRILDGISYRLEDLLLQEMGGGGE
ncbi:MAG: hypothetical protein AAF456_09735 [Planctomycetota bacterium]